jgi:hypothetical protein
VDKADFLLWSSKYDKSQGWRVQREQELGGRFRRLKTMTLPDLLAVVEWQYKTDETRQKRVQEAVQRNSEAAVARLSSQAFNLPTEDDACRLNCLLMLEGVSPVLASIILTFFDPSRYCVFDLFAWRASLGNEPPNLFTPQNYLRLLAALRKTAAKHNLGVRVVEKALVKKKLDEAGLVEVGSRRRVPTPAGKPKPRNKQKW